jgi:hypothetical protein
MPQRQQDEGGEKATAITAAEGMTLDAALALSLGRKAKTRLEDGRVLYVDQVATLDQFGWRHSEISYFTIERGEYCRQTPLVPHDQLVWYPLEAPFPARSTLLSALHQKDERARQILMRLDTLQCDYRSAYKKADGGISVLQKITFLRRYVAAVEELLATTVAAVGSTTNHHHQHFHFHFHRRRRVMSNNTSPASRQDDLVSASAASEAAADIGDSVRYVLDIGPSTGEDRLAFVVKRRSDDTKGVNLLVLTDCAGDFPMQFGPLSGGEGLLWRPDAHYSAEGEPGTWHWPHTPTGETIISTTASARQAGDLDAQDTGLILTKRQVQTVAALLAAALATNSFLEKSNLLVKLATLLNVSIPQEMILAARLAYASTQQHQQHQREEEHNTHGNNTSSGPR